VEAQAVSIVPGLVFVSEREAGPWIDCGPCSAAMVAHYADPKIAASLATAHAIRGAVPLPHSGGLTPAQLIRGLDRAFVGIAGRTTSHSRGEVPGLVRAGYAVVLSLTYGELPTRLRRWQPSFAGGHSVCLAGVNSSGRFGWFDPLATSGWSGEWVSWTDVMPAVWSQAGAILAAPRAPVQPPAPAPAARPPAEELRYGGTSSGRGRYAVRADGTRVRDRPSTAGRIVRELRQGDTFAVGQTTRTGSSVDGSRVWRGTRDGTRWVHDSLVRSLGHTTGTEDVR
jgi:hypothetical protein